MEKFPKENLKFPLKISVSIMVILMSLLFSILYLARNGQTNEILFWVLIISIFTVIFLQYKFSKFSKKEEFILVIELVLLNILLHGIYQLPFETIYGADSYSDMVAVKDILISGHVQNSLSVSLWPSIHLFGVSVFYLSNIDVSNIIKYGAMLIEISFPLLLYISFKKIICYKYPHVRNANIAFLATLFCISIQSHIQFNSTFIRETIAIIILLLFLYFYYKRMYTDKKEKNIVFSILILISIIELTLSHHFTSFMLIILFLMLYFYEKFFKNEFSSNILILIFVIIFAYWTYIALLPLMTMGDFIQSMLYPGHTYAELANINVGEIATIRGEILLYGFLLFNAFFSLILLIKYRFIKKVYSFVLFLFFCGAVGFLGTFFLSITIYPTRLISFGWLLGSLPLILAIYKIDNIKIKKISLLVVFLFLIFNIYQIEPAIYTDLNGVYTQPSIEDYAAINTINMSNGNILSFQNDKLAILDVYGNKNATSLDSSTVNQRIKAAYNNYYDFVILNKNFISFIDTDKVAKYSYASYLNYTKSLDTFNNYQKVYDSNDVSIYQKN
ncbi:MAG: hypothetical protein ACPK7O_05100 [Methanobacterium sp.]